MRKALFFFCCLVFPALGYGQLTNATLRLSANYPIIPGVTNDVEPVTVAPAASGYSVTWTNIPDVKETYETRPGFDFSFNFDPYTRGKFFLGAGLGIQYYAYKRTIELIANDEPMILYPGGLPLPSPGPYGVIVGGDPEPDPTGAITLTPSGSYPGAADPDSRIGQTATLYAQLPLVIGRVFLQDRLKIRLGVTASLLILSSEYKQMYSYSYQNGPQWQVVKDTSGDGFSNLTMGGVFETSYMVAKRVSLHLSYLRSFTPIYDEGNRPGGNAIYNTISFGAGWQVGK